MLSRWINKLKPKFCRECGSPLEERTYITGYSERTGMQTVESYLACEKRRWEGPGEFDYPYAACK